MRQLVGQGHLLHRRRVVRADEHQLPRQRVVVPDDLGTGEPLDRTADAGAGWDDPDGLPRPAPAVEELRGVRGVEGLAQPLHQIVVGDRIDRDRLGELQAPHLLDLALDLLDDGGCGPLGTGRGRLGRRTPAQPLQRGLRGAGAGRGRGRRLRRRRDWRTRPGSNWVGTRTGASRTDQAERQQCGGEEAGPSDHRRGAATLATAATTAAAEKPAETHRSPMEFNDPSDAMTRMTPATDMSANATA